MSPDKILMSVILFMAKSDPPLMAKGLTPSFFPIIPQEKVFALNASVGT